MTPISLPHVKSPDTRRKTARPRGVWLLVLLLGVGRLQAAEPVMPPVAGEGSEQLTTADVDNMAALARPLVAGVLEPVLVDTSVSSSKTEAAELERATIYFAPRETNARSWRGYCLRCCAAAIHWLDDEPSHWRKVGKWTVPVEEEMDEYIIPAPAGKDLPVWPVNDFASYQRMGLASKLETGVLLGLIDTARGYSMLLPDGTELSFADLPLVDVGASANQKGEITGLVGVVPPRGKLRSPWTIHVRALFLNKAGWRITKVDQYVYY